MYNHIYFYLVAVVALGGGVADSHLLIIAGTIERHDAGRVLPEVVKNLNALCWK